MKEIAKKNDALKMLLTKQVVKSSVVSPNSQEITNLVTHFQLCSNHNIWNIFRTEKGTTTLPGFCGRRLQKTWQL